MRISTLTNRREETNMVNTQPSSGDADKKLREQLKQIAESLGVYDFDKRTDFFSNMNALLASNSIRITGVSLASSDENGVSGLITYEYKWVPSDTEKAAPRWDTGMINMLGDTDNAVLGAYVEIFETVNKTRASIKKSKEQVKTL